MRGVLLFVCGLSAVLYVDAAARANAAQVNFPSNFRRVVPASQAGKRPNVVAPAVRRPISAQFPPRSRQTIVTGGRINPIKIIRPGARIPFPVVPAPAPAPVPVPAPAQSGARATPVRVDPSAVRAEARALTATRHSNARASSAARVQQEASQSTGARQIFSAPARTGQASAARNQISQGGRNIPLSSVTRNGGVVTQNGAAVTIIITDTFVIIDGWVYFIENGYIFIHGVQFTVCGITIAPASLFICCSGQLLLKFDPANNFEEIQCCGAEFFFPASEICCDGFFAPREISGYATDCCGSEIYFPEFQICCDGVIWETGDELVPISVLSCCATEAYDNRFDTCCGGIIQIIGSTDSCGCLDPAIYLCCGGVPVARGPNGACCGSVQINTLTQRCCFGFIPRPIGVQCFFTPTATQPPAPYPPHPPSGPGYSGYSGYSGYKKK